MPRLPPRSTPSSRAAGVRRRGRATLRPEVRVCRSRGANPGVKVPADASRTVPQDHTAQRNAAVALGAETLPALFRRSAPVVAATAYRDAGVWRGARDLLRAVAHSHSAGGAG